MEVTESNGVPVKLIRGAILADRLDVGASADLFLTLIEVYSKSLLVNAS